MPSEFRLPIFRPLGFGLNSFVRRLDSIQTSQILSNFGPQEAELRDRVASITGASPSNVVTFSSGFDALRGAVAAQSGSSWSVPDFSFAGCPLAVLDSGRGATVVDVSSETWTSSTHHFPPETSGDLRLVPFGKSFAVEDYVCEDRPTIIDAAASFGNAQPFFPRMESNVMVMFSFHATKVFGAAEGGVLVVPNSETAESIRRWSNFGISKDGITTAAGVNAKMAEISAAAINSNLERQTQIKDLFLELRAKARDIEAEFNLDGWLGDSDVSPYWAVRMPRSELVHSLTALGAEHSVEFRPLWRTRASQIKHPQLSRSNCKFPVSDELFKSVIGLPFWPGMTSQDFQLIRRLLGKLELQR